MDEILFEIAEVAGKMKQSQQEGRFYEQAALLSSETLPEFIELGNCFQNAFLSAKISPNFERNGYEYQKAFFLHDWMWNEFNLTKQNNENQTKFEFEEWPNFFKEKTAGQWNLDLFFQAMLDYFKLDFSLLKAQNQYFFEVGKTGHIISSEKEGCMLDLARKTQLGQLENVKKFELLSKITLQKATLLEEDGKLEKAVQRHYLARIYEKAAGIKK